MKVLFVATRSDKPSFRFRIEQMIPYFQCRGHECSVAFWPRSFWRRLSLLKRFSQVDCVCVQRRLIGPAELALARRRTRRLVYDFDDAVMYKDSGHPDRRRQRRFRHMMRAADLAVCGNRYLADLASAGNSNICHVPTAIDTVRFQPSNKTLGSGPVTIGWTGSRATNRYLADLLPVIAQLGNSVRLKVISDRPEGLDSEFLHGMSFQFVRWSRDTEVREASTFDIGLMPLPDNAWTRGKCGLKALQYLALGIPAACSPVGVNCEILDDGRTGFLPGSAGAWHNVLQTLVNDGTLRRRVGGAGRKHVEGTYALAIQGPQLVAAFERLEMGEATVRRAA